MTKHLPLAVTLLTLLAAISGKCYAAPVYPVSPTAANTRGLQKDKEIGRIYKLDPGTIDTATTYEDLKNLYFYRYLIGEGANRLKGESDDDLKQHGFSWTDIKTDIERRKAALTEAIAQKKVGVAEGGVKVRAIERRDWKFGHGFDQSSLPKTTIEKWAFQPYDFGGSFDAYKVQFLEGPLAGEQRWMTVNLGRDMESQSGEEAFKSVIGGGDVVLPPAIKNADTPSASDTALPGVGTVTTPIERKPSKSLSTAPAAMQPFTYLGSFTVPYTKSSEKGNALVVVNSIKTAAVKKLDLQYLHAENGRMVVFDNELLEGDAQTKPFLTSIKATKTTIRRHADYAYQFEPSTSAAILTATSGRIYQYQAVGKSNTRSTTPNPLPSSPSIDGSKDLPALKYNGPVSVHGYTRKDGTYVRPHTRSAPGTRSGGRKR